MDSGNKFMALASIVIVALILQVVLIFADHHESPGKTAVEFSKAYFKLNKGMKDFLCSEIRADEDTDVVGDYINRKADEAKNNGFAPNWMKMALSHIEIKTEMVDDKTANVHITCTRQRSVNPLFGVVSKIFFLGETHNVEGTLTVVKEDDGWKVCGQPFELIEG